MRKDSKTQGELLVEDGVDHEYRIITGCEDGSVYFWNFEVKDQDFLKQY